ncbi:unnamed protein product [Cunninghamella blakesleeana]
MGKRNVEGEPELLFMQRASRDGDRWSGHVAFIGGKNEPGESDDDTVIREVKEEIGLDLDDKNAFIKLGRLDDREIISTYNKKLLMILVPFVYLQIVPHTPKMELQTDEVASVEWVPLSFFLNPIHPNHSVQMMETLTPRLTNGWRRKVAQILLGTITFPAIDLPLQPLPHLDNNDGPKRRFRLWGLTLGMTRDILQLTNQPNLPFISLVTTSPSYSRKDIGWSIQFVYSITYFWKKYITKSLYTSTIKSQHKATLDKIYYGSIRKGIALALISRLTFIGLVLLWISRGKYKHYLK